MGLEFEHTYTVDLLQKHGPHAQGARQCLPVGLHMSRCVSHMVAQIQAAPGRP
jgi:hypothetical protein